MNKKVNRSKPHESSTKTKNERKQWSCSTPVNCPQTNMSYLIQRPPRTLNYIKETSKRCISGRMLTGKHEELGSEQAHFFQRTNWLWTGRNLKRNLYHRIQGKFKDDGMGTMWLDDTGPGVTVLGEGVMTRNDQGREKSTTMGLRLLHTNPTSTGWPPF